MDLNKLNGYQTQITDELKKKYHKEIWNELLEYLSTVKFLQNLIAPEEIRGFAKDQPKETEFYNDGRIQVDITKPHILQDLDFFRERAIFFENNGKYTNLIPNSNPKSEYANFWKEELHRWKYGMIRPSDGEWIPGYLYFYWNYSPIWLVVNKKGSKQGDRVRKFPKPWLGDYIFFHYLDQARCHGKHGKNLKARGIGMSFKNAAMSPRNMYVYPGAGNVNFHLANEKSYLQGDKGLYGKVLEVLDHIADTTPLPRMRLIDGKKEMVVQLGYTDEYGGRKGLLSSTHAISLKDNPDKARGARGVFCHYEEDGIFDNLEKAWNVNRPGFEDGGIAVGLMLAAGTGGVEGASFEGSQKLFYNHDSYNIYGIPNVFDKNTDGSTTCGHFWGAYLNRHECYNLDTGEPDIIKSLLEILSERFIVKYGSSDPNAITQKKAELPITPQEAIMRTEGTVFPIADIKSYLETIAPKKESFLAEHLVGDLIVNNDGQVEWKPNSDISPLRSFESSDTNRTGAVEIFEMPKKNSEGTIPRGRYIAGIDPIDSDAGASLFSVIVMDLFTDRIVAEYTGRPKLASDAYETTLRLLKFYNAEGNYESNLKGLFSYFDNKNSLYYLADVPQILKDMEMVRATNLFGNKAKGTHANKQINSWGRQLQAEYMLTDAHGHTEEDEEGNIISSKLNLHTVRTIPYLEECIAWNSDGNFDRVSAAGMLFILREDRRKRTETARKNKDGNPSHLSNDPFFKKNFKQKRYGSLL